MRLRKLLLILRQSVDAARRAGDVFPEAEGFANPGGWAVGLTPRAVLEKFAVIQMLDVHFPNYGRELIFTRYTQPEKAPPLLLEQLGWSLPAQPRSRITAKREVVR